MKQIDKLIATTFLRLFAVTFLVGFFVILMQFFLIEFNRFIGKGLPWSIYLQISYHICLFAIKQAFPMAILLASVMTMGRLSEHHELMALKSAGISLPRVLRPILISVCLLSAAAWYCNSYLVPRAFLDAFSLVYDLGFKKPAISIQEGVFYNDIPGYSIKVEKKSEHQGLQGIMIYGHTDEAARMTLTTAQSGKIYTTKDGAYMAIELFDGYDYRDTPGGTSVDKKSATDPFVSSRFKSQKLMFSLASFQLSRTDKHRFAHDARTQNASQLWEKMRTLQQSIQTTRAEIKALRQWPIPSENNVSDSTTEAQLSDQVAPTAQHSAQHNVVYKEALEKATHMSDSLAKKTRELNTLQRAWDNSAFEWHKMIAWSMACLFVFFAGAPLGAIIRRGGLGIPLLVAAAIIIWHFIFQMLGEEWVDKGQMGPIMGAWLPNLSLVPFSIFFYIQARRDARLLDIDTYAIVWGKIKQYFPKFW